MQLKVTRDQEKKGWMLGKTVYTLNMRVEFSEEERAAINAKDLGSWTLFEHEKKRVTVKGLKDGQHFESDDLAFITDVEAKIREGCKSLKGHIQVSNAFDGSAEVEDI